MEQENIRQRDQTEQELLVADQEGKFSYIEVIVPEITGKISDLTQVLQENPGDLHSTFWLLYLKSYNTYVWTIRSDLDRNHIETDTHKNAIQEWFDEDILPTMELSKENKVFEKNPTAGGLMEMLKVSYAYDNDFIYDYESSILDTPSRIRKLAEPTPTPNP